MNMENDLSPLAATCLAQGYPPSLLELIAEQFTLAAAELRARVGEAIGHA